MGFTEKKLVEDYIIDKLQEKGWKYIPANELERETLEEPLLIPNLLRALQRINRAQNAGNEEIQRVVNELKITGIQMEGAKRMLQFYKFGVPVKFEKEKVVKYVRIFDYENIRNNELIVTRQSYFQGVERIRTDIILYLNGIPIVDIECKDPTNISESWVNAFTQIKEYENKVPDLYKYVQIGVVASEIAKYFPVVPWQEEVRTYEWKEEGRDSIDSTIEMLSRDTILDILEHYIFSTVERGEGTKVIARYMQYRASNKIVERVIENLEGRSTKDRGLIWHWQGSGKTLTMIFAANKLFYLRRLSTPTIFFIVDRKELEEQLYDEFNALDLVEPERIEGIHDLKAKIKHDSYRGKRGIFITLIHKFRTEELLELQKELQGLSEKKETIMNRKNVIAFVDEGHRTQYGILASQMKSIFQNAFFFAFTGTPISKRGKDTYIEFSYPEEELYLDRYFVKDSIKDEFTVKIIYQPRLGKDIQLNRDLLETFLESEFDELPEDVRNEVEDRVKQKLDLITLVFEDPNRIKTNSEDMVRHFKENVEDRFKAMIVAGSRKACVLYKAELDRLLPREYSEVVMTCSDSNKTEVLEYCEEMRDRFNGKETDDILKEIVERFKEEELPRILVVTEMLLTGFDAPTLGVMYLDKPLKEHRLLQAIARTNRPYKDLKEAGIIIDYVGVLKEFRKAFAQYSEEDLGGILSSVEALEEEFVSLIDETKETLPDIPVNYERDTMFNAIEVLTTDEEKARYFISHYKKVRKLFELLGADRIKVEYFDLYKWLSSVYTYYMKVVFQKYPYEEYVQKYYNKTIQFVHQSTEVSTIAQGLPSVVFDEDYLESLERSLDSKREKAANILFTLNKLVLVDRYRNPVYESLVERVQRLLELWKERTKDYERIYTDGVKTIEEIHALTERKKKLQLSDLEYAIILELEKRISDGDALVNMAKGLYGKLDKYLFNGWTNQITAQKEMEREIRKFVREIKGKHGLSFSEMNSLHEKISENVKNYAKH
jgi:type I restriction enzyme R subunit